MAPVPKKKHSRQRSRIRRGSKRISIPSHLWGLAGLGKKTEKVETEKEKVKKDKKK